MIGQISSESSDFIFLFNITYINQKHKTGKNKNDFETNNQRNYLIFVNLQNKKVLEQMISTSSCQSLCKSESSTQSQRNNVMLRHGLRPSYGSVGPQNLPDSNQNRYYYMAKTQEYDYKNLSLAVHYYRKAIESGQKVESAIKDLAAVLHQSGKTKEAVDFLLKYRGLYRGDLEKYDNLTANLRKQISVPSGKNLNKYILLVGLDQNQIKTPQLLFGNYSRIQEIGRYQDLSLARPGTDYCLLGFGSYSAARKTLDTFRFKDFPGLELYWVNVNRLIVCQASLSKEESTDLNSYYYGFCAFENKLMILEHTEFYCLADFKESNIDAIWESHVHDPMHQEHDFALDRVRMENSAKLDLLRSKRYVRNSRGVLRA